MTYDDLSDDIGQVLVNFWNGDADEDTTNAALMHIASQAWDDGYDYTGPRHDNPYRD